VVSLSSAYHLVCWDSSSAIVAIDTAEIAAAVAKHLARSVDPLPVDATACQC